MLFKKKEYICIPLSVMYVYGENPKEIISSVSTNNSLLSDGTEIKLFLEYTPNNKDINNFSSLKEIITGTRYERTNENNPLETFYSEKTKTSCIDYNNHQFEPINPKILKQYLKELKEKNLYKEYVERINQFYQASLKINQNKEDIIGPTR